MKSFSYLWVITTILMVACEHDSPELYYTPNPVDLSLPADGQASHYIRYTTTCEDLTGELEYRGDTLTLAISERNDSLFFQEYYTQLSTAYTEDKIQDTIMHHFEIVENDLLIRDRLMSQLFYFYGNDTIHLTPSGRSVMHQKGCRVFLKDVVFVGDEIGQLDHFLMAGKSIHHQTVVSCVPDFFALEGYLLYSPNGLQLSHTIINDRVTGWIKL
ncbi:hypothetical protein [Reichenbachiella agariperforans]|uniref:hypothetical protein n=1 Tax=Reichenbachiella agariperforans TaxID=156994 RepID=UPI001C0A3C87|nr:hypothetical protein [Reichenbachiella agariperforans]MBU2916321.1 hypothetical protein [Reichenbachiella agariperforans]